MKKPTILSQIGNRIRELRKKTGMSQEQLAAKADLDRTYVGGIERGERNVSMLNLEKICKALKIDVPNFFKGMTK